jgi:chemotaxis protein CheZ
MADPGDDSPSLTEILEQVRTMAKKATTKQAVGADTIRKTELLELVAFIEKAKADITGARPEEITAQHIPQSRGELDAVATHAETLTSAMLDAAEALDKVAADAEAKTADAIRKITAGIYEAANFHDITNQRITKVVRALTQIETKMTSILRALGHDVSGLPAAPASDQPAHEEEGLLNGPQLPGNAISQDDIDSMFGDEAANQDDIDALFDDEPAKG